MPSPARRPNNSACRCHEPRWHDRPVVLEGGSIDVNGAGLLLTTEECLLSDVQQRNRGLQRGDLERLFRRLPRHPQGLWLGEAIAGDDTHAHRRPGPFSSPRGRW